MILTNILSFLPSIQITQKIKQNVPYGPNKIQLFVQFVMKMHQNAAPTQNKALNKPKHVAITLKNTYCI